MRIFFIALFFNLLLFSKNFEDVCYSIQIASFKNSSLEELQKIPLAKNCVVMENEKGGYFIGCECSDKKEISKKLSKYKKKIPKAFIVKIRRNLFELAKEKKNLLKNPDLQELIYRVFIYNNDLKNAYKIAYEKVKENPNTLLWRKRLADILLWSGKNREALDEYFYIYKKTQDKKLERIILKASVEGRDYEKAYEIIKKKLFSHPDNKKYLKEFTALAYKSGKIEESAKILDKVYRKSKNATVLKNSALLYYKSGNLEEAKKRFLLIKKAGMLDVDGAKILSEIFFAEKKPALALKALLSVKKRVSSKDRDYWRRVSLLYEYLNRADKAIEILYGLCLKGECDREDYDKLIRYFYGKDEKKALKISYKAFKKFQDPSYFIYYAKILLKRDEPERVYEKLLTLSWKMRKRMENLPSFWLVKANLFRKIGKVKKADFCYRKALSLDENSSEILAQYADFLLFSGRAEELRKVLKKAERKAKKDASLYIVLASLYYSLDEPSKASFFYKKALKAYPFDVNLKIAYAEFLKASGNETEAFKILRKIYLKLAKRLRNDPSLLKKRFFLKPFLEVSLYFVNGKKYEEFLKYAKEILSEDEYERYRLSYALYKKRDREAEFIAKRLKNKALWLRIRLALNRGDKEALKDLLYRYSSFIPSYEKSKLYLKTGNVAGAMSASFEALEKYPKNRSVYKNREALLESYADRFDSEAGYRKREDLKTFYAKFQNLSHLSDEYYLGVRIEADRYEYESVFKEYAFKMWLKALSDRGFVKIGIGYRDTDDPYLNYFLYLHSKFGDAVESDFKIYKNEKSDESIDLLLCGKKEGGSANIRYLLSSRSAFSTLLEANRYRLLNGESVGKSYKLMLSAFQKTRLSYPNVTFREFISFMKFSDQNFKYLPPKDYVEGGVGVSLGDAFRGKRFYRWRPYADFSLFKNSLFGLSYAAVVGASGGFLGDDNLDVSLNYNRSAGSFNDELWFLKLKHSYLY